MWLLGTDFTDFQIEFERVLKKLTHGRRFWHGLHGIKIKVQKFHQGGLSLAIENRFSQIHMWLLGTDFTDLQLKFESVLKN